MRPALLLAGFLALGASTPTDYYNGGGGGLTTGTVTNSDSSSLLNLFSGDSSSSSSSSSGGCDFATGVGCRGNSGTNGFSTGGCDTATGVGCGGNSGTNGFSTGGCNTATGVGCRGNSGTNGFSTGGCNTATGVGCGGNSGSTGCNPTTGIGCGNGGNIVSSGGGSIKCPQDRVVTVPRVSTSILNVVNTINVPEQRTQFVTQTSLVPSFTTSFVVRTDIDTRTDFRTRTVTNVNTQEVSSTVRLPDRFATVLKTVRRTQVDTDFVTQTQYVTKQDVRTSVSVVNVQRQVESVVRVPQLRVSTKVVQVPGPGRTQVKTVFDTREVISYYQPAPKTIVQTSISFKTDVISRTVRQPDTIITVSSVKIVPVTSIIINSRFVPQFVTVTETDDITITRTEATTQVVPVRSTIVQNVIKTDFVTDFVTLTEQVVRTRVQQLEETVRVPGQPRVVFRTEPVQIASTVRGADTFSTQIVTVPRQREVISTKVVQRVVNQERVVKQVRGGGYCGGGHSNGYGGYNRY